MLSFLHNKIPCKHKNVWVAHNLTHLDMLFLSIIAYFNKPNKSNIILALFLLLAFCNNRILVLP